MAPPRRFRPSPEEHGTHHLHESIQERALKEPCAVRPMGSDAAYTVCIIQHAWKRSEDVTR
jgi:hypothetical protein